MLGYIEDRSKAFRKQVTKRQANRWIHRPAYSGDLMTAFEGMSDQVIGHNYRRAFEAAVSLPEPQAKTKLMRQCFGKHSEPISKEDRQRNRTVRRGRFLAFEAIHVGSKCSSCYNCHIRGVMYKCLVCAPEQSTYCSWCYKSGRFIFRHGPHHEVLELAIAIPPQMLSVCRTNTQIEMYPVGGLNAIVKTFLLNEQYMMDSFASKYQNKFAGVGGPDSRRFFEDYAAFRTWSVLFGEIERVPVESIIANFYPEHQTRMSHFADNSAKVDHYTFLALQALVDLSTDTVSFWAYTRILHAARRKDLSDLACMALSDKPELIRGDPRDALEFDIACCMESYQVIRDQLCVSGHQSENFNPAQVKNENFEMLNALFFKRDIDYARVKYRPIAARLLDHTKLIMQDGGDVSQQYHRKAFFQAQLLLKLCMMEPSIARIYFDTLCFL
eukprot:scpid64599/ scgid31793/ 